MDHSELFFLIKKTITKKGGTWADFGSGDGAFTLALRDLAGKDVKIFSIDQDIKRLSNQKENFAKQFPDTNITFLNTDFTKSLELPQLDGIIMANSLHYVEDQIDFLKLVKNEYLNPNGKLVFVEYNTEVKSPWVPYPISIKKFGELMEQTGFTNSKILEKIPSDYWKEMYSAEAVKL